MSVTSTIECVLGRYCSYHYTIDSILIMVSQGSHAAAKMTALFFSTGLLADAQVYALDIIL